MKQIGELVKRIQINEEGDVVLGTPCMVGFLNSLAIAGIEPKDVFNISKEGVVIEIKPFPKDFPEDQKINATCFLMNQISIRNIIDHQKLSNAFANSYASKKS